MDNNEINKIITEIATLIDFEKRSYSSEEKQIILDKIDSIIAYDPENVDAYIWKGLFYQKISEYDKAIEAFKKVTEINPSNEIALDGIKNNMEYKNWSITDRSSLNSQESTLTSQLDFDIFSKISYKVIILLKIIIIITLAFTVFNPIALNIMEKTTLNKINNISKSQNLQNISVNSPMPLSFLSKEEIYSIRRRYVQKSIFASPNYEPNNQIFGQIIDHKPWWTTAPCSKLDYQGDYHERTEGDSKVSISINNPSALVTISLPYSPWEWNDNQEFCYGEYGKFIPSSIKYDKRNKTIITSYKVGKNFPKYRTNVNGNTTRYLLQLSGLNAIDFGYRYTYIFDLSNIIMTNSDNIRTNIGTFNDYIHLGRSCQYEDGCNNISPMQNDKMFTIAELPAEINLKLWKNKPKDKFSKPDMYYRIIFESL